MNQFVIPDAEVKFGHLNVRTEKHGDTDVTAVDLTLEWMTANTVLEQFSPDLREALYAPEHGQSKRLPDVEQVFNARLFPHIGPLHWNYEYTGLELKIRHGINGDTDLRLCDCTADKFTIDAKDGGTVAIGFRVRATCEDERVLGKLPLLLKRNLQMHLDVAHPAGA